MTSKPNNGKRASEQLTKSNQLQNHPKFIRVHGA